ncbi:MAG: hypothetical protein HY751_05265 [Nitrospinae bacterium]|nr:hypothetical protein [Nitrospinota bacterium]
MKSALELAMEKAAKLTGGELKSLSASQKAAIAEARSKTEAKIAEAKIMLDEKMKKIAGRPEYAAALEEAKENFRQEKTRVEEALEREIEAIRRQ